MNDNNKKRSGAPSNVPYQGGSDLLAGTTASTVGTATAIVNSSSTEQQEAQQRGKRQCTTEAKKTAGLSSSATQEQAGADAALMVLCRVKSLNFSDLPRDNRLCILSFLTEEELHESFSIVSKQCHEDSSDDFPQIKTGEIVCTPDCTIRELLSKLLQSRNAFQIPRTKMRLSGHWRIDPARVGRGMAPAYRRLRAVTSLDLSIPITIPENERILQLCVPRLLSIMLPNLVEVNLSNSIIATDQTSSALRNFKSCVNLKRITWHGARRFPFAALCLKDLTSLTELYLDDTCMKWPGSELPQAHQSQFVLHDSNFSSLERVSLKNVKCQVRGRMQAHAQAIPQESMKELVRHCPNLQWFRSDLTQENVDQMKGENDQVAYRS